MAINKIKYINIGSEMEESDFVKHSSHRCVLQSLNVTENGVYLPPEGIDGFNRVDVNVPTTPVLYREFQLSGTGVLVPNTTTTHIMNFTGMTGVSNFALTRAYYQNTAISGAVVMGDLTAINGSYACSYMFYNCTGITSAVLSALAIIGGSYACEYMFAGCGLTSANLSALTTIIGNNACQYMFYGCTGLTNAILSALTTISGSYACFFMFNGCIGIINADLSALTTISGNYACEYMFSGCTSLATVYIGGTTAIDFGTLTNQFTNMFYGCPQNIDVYAPAANQTQIEAFSGYPNFGGTGNVVWHWRS